ncbi:hypothetical protein HPB47_027981 [Ixodes persulcatus]|uniref:Uncharacterized protein n=1 Tax=Ixodes persulcatus TaxID=34615 RepID=A0AC60PWC7_IXOPE|nr:hypothetical protein HPB47_027981 [Ixodes persulcatus]
MKMCTICVQAPNDEPQTDDIEDLGEPARPPSSSRPIVATVTHRKRARSPVERRSDDDLRKSWRETLGPPPQLGHSRKELVAWLEFHKKKWELQRKQRQARGKRLNRGEGAASTSGAKASASSGAIIRAGGTATLGGFLRKAQRNLLDSPWQIIQSAAHVYSEYETERELRPPRRLVDASQKEEDDEAARRLPLETFRALTVHGKFPLPVRTDFSDLLTLATAAYAFAWSPLQREGELPTLQREAPFDAPLEPSVAPTPSRTGAIAPGSSLSAPAPPPAQSEAYRSPHEETAAAPHHTLLENAARVIESLTASAALEPRCAWSGDTPSRAPRRYDSANYAEDRGRDTYAISDRALDPYSYGRRTSRPTPQFRTTDSRPNEAARQEETRIPQSQRADARYDRAGENQNARRNPRRGDDRRCFRCNRPGHLARQCPERPNTESHRAGNEQSHRTSRTYEEDLSLCFAPFGSCCLLATAVQRRSWTTAARDSPGGPATPAGRGPNQQRVVFVGLRDRHPARDCPLIIFGTRAAVGKLADQGPAVPVRPVNKFLWLRDLRSPNCQGVTHLTGRPGGKFDPEGLIFAIRLHSEPDKLYDLRAFDKGPFDTFKLPRDKECD